MTQPLNLDIDIMKDLAKIHCTIEEIATIMNCSVQLLKNNQTYIDIIKKGKEEGRECLRRLQFKIAEGRRAELLTDDQGNIIKDDKGKPMIDKPGYAPVPAMAIFLGKNLLGQTDQQIVSLHQEQPVEVIIKNYEKVKDGKESSEQAQG